MAYYINVESEYSLICYRLKKINSKNEKKAFEKFVEWYIGEFDENKVEDHLDFRFYRSDDGYTFVMVNTRDNEEWNYEDYR